MGKKKSGKSGQPAPPEAPVVENPNLAVLKRKDASLIDIIASSGHVVVYRFTASGWEKKNVEGPLFIVSRARAPFYRMIVLNRVTLHNLVEDLTPEFQLERNGPYLMYANTKGDTHGFWFPEEDTLERMQAQLLSCIKKAGHQPKSRPAPAPAPAPAPVAVLPRPANKQQKSPAQPRVAQPNPAQSDEQERAKAAASIMAAVGMLTPAPAPAPAPQAPVQNVSSRVPASAGSMRSAAVAFAQGLKVLNGGEASSLNEVQAKLFELARNPDFVQMVTLAQAQP